MRTLVIYDSKYGNTKKLAEAIGESLGSMPLVASRVEKVDFKEIDLLVVGCPTHGGRPTTGMQVFINGTKDGYLKGKKIACFDTRLDEGKQKLALRLLMKVIGYAAPRMATELKRKGGKLVVCPEGFMVVDKEGPIAEGEIERARAWAKGLARL